MKVKLNAAQIACLADALNTNPGDHDPDECEIEIQDINIIVEKEGKPFSSTYVGQQLLLDGAYLHTDGDFATWPEEPKE